ncbi:MAG: hypothetical protein ABIR56_10995 [Polaromonas sp.]
MHASPDSLIACLPQGAMADVVNDVGGKPRIVRLAHFSWYFLRFTNTGRAQEAIIFESVSVLSRHPAQPSFSRPTAIIPA